MKLRIFIFLCSFYFSASGQSIDNKFIGDWMFIKAELIEQALKEPENLSIKEYGEIKEPFDHFLLNQCILKIHWIQEESFIDIGFNRLKNPMIIEENGFIILEDETGNTFGPYYLDFISDDGLLVKTSEVFYNSVSGKPMKARLNIYLKKE